MDRYRDPFPDLEGERVILRELKNDDIEFIYKHFSNRNVCEYLYDEEPFTDIKEAEDFVLWNSKTNRKNHNRWGIVGRINNVLMGTCGFHCWDKTNHIAEIGYDLYYDYWGQGYMSDALKVVLKNGFLNMNLNRIQAYVAVENKNSINILQRLGFKNEGVFRDKHYFRGKYYDHYSFSLLRSEWCER